jgi:hypothetical protein
VAHLGRLRRLRRLLLNASFWQPQSLSQRPTAPHSGVPQPPPELLLLPAPPPPAEEAQQPHQPQPQYEQGQGQQQQQQQQQGLGAGQGNSCAQQLPQLPQQQQQQVRDAEAAAAALTSLCGGAPECLYDIALASYGRAAARFCAMQAMVAVEAEVPRVGCGALRLWVCP